MTDTWEQVGEKVFIVAGTHATPVTAIALVDAGLKERSHLQEWVIENPSILGDGVMIVTAELGKWLTGAGAKESDRLDVLGLDREGRLVVAELKRGVAPDPMEMQAIKYTALANRFDLERLAEQHADFLGNRSQAAISEDDARAILLNHAPEVSDETLRPPRIVLVASDFPPPIAAVAVYLNEVGVELTLVRFHAYKTPGEEIVLTISQMYPMPSAEDFTLTPAAARRKEEKRRTRAARIVSRLVEADAIPEGTKFTLTNIPEQGQGAEAVTAWIAADPSRGVARWQNSKSKPLIWQPDGQAYSPSGLVSAIYEAAAGTNRPSAFWGPGYWADPTGKILWELAQDLD